MLLHGLFGSKLNFNSFAKAIHAPRCIVADLRNHGSSPHHDDMSIEAMVADTLHLMDEIGIEEWVLVGHSLGGKVAMATALMHPDRVRKMGCIDMAPVDYLSVESPKNRDGYSTRDVVELVHSIHLAQEGITNRKEADALLQKRAPWLSEGLRAFLLQSAHERSDGTWGWKMNVGAIMRCYPQLAGWEYPASLTYHQPSLFIKGSESRFIENHYLPAIYEHFPNALLEVIPDAGHWVHSEKPRETLELLNDFIAASDEADREGAPMDTEGRYRAA
ncbi:unnamed protein product [Vitrella brassicaformis CCMP3155]|uniref:AB hydrolase-1 domain-containing protein n=1 Tax=Vitrella brassicaformis (strain CCMP3155) TaxID=1169540 RepID=A0A0G4FNY0_VITBC|nr:unnamed protein product [Vitrella brassicaformis CCMP3155]|eukprot:CEM15935.1 unnamed protein product [Vitrella brassicaformis CCMP3155]